MKIKKKIFAAAIILMVIIGSVVCVSIFQHRKSSNMNIKQVIHNYTTLQESIDHVEKTYLDENGYVSIDNREALLADIENAVSESKKSGVIKSYKRETEGIFADLGGVSYFYTPPIENTMSQPSEKVENSKVHETEKKEIITIEPYPTQYKTVLTYGTSGFKSPDNAAEKIVSTFPDNYVFPETNNTDTFLPEQGKDLEGKSIIIWYGHGVYTEEYGPVLGGDLKANSKNIVAYSLYLANFNGEPEMIIKHKKLAYTPYYFQHNIGDNTLKGSLVYIAACSSMKDHRLADVFIEKGADLIVGNSAEIRTRYNLNMMTTFLESLTERNANNEYMNAEEAMSAARQKQGSSDSYGPENAQVLMKYAPGTTEYRLNVQSDKQTVTSKGGPATQVEIKYSSDSGKKSAVIYGLNSEKKEVWKHKTEAYDQTESEQISDIGIFDNQFYYCEGGKIVSLALSNGSVLWENNEFGGASICAVIDNNGTIYISGYFGPSFFAVDKNGVTLGKIDSFGDEYYGPYAIEKINNTTVAVTLEHGPERGTMETKSYVVYVELNDYSFSVVTTNEETENDGGSSVTQEALVGKWIQTDSNDPIMLTLDDDGSIQYYATISDSNEYTSTFKWDGTLWLNLVNIDNSGTTLVPYQVSMFSEGGTVQMILHLEKNEQTENYTPLYNMEKILEGTYQKIG